MAHRERTFYFEDIGGGASVADLILADLSATDAAELPAITSATYADVAGDWWDTFAGDERGGWYREWVPGYVPVTFADAVEAHRRYAAGERMSHDEILGLVDR